MKKLIYLTVLLCVKLLHAQSDFLPISLDAEYSYRMLEQNQNLRKINMLWEAKKQGVLKPGQLLVGTSLIALVDYQSSNTDSKFGYLMRHPTAANEVGTSVSEAVIHSFQLALTAPVNAWITTYAEMLYNPEQSFGTGTITALSRNQLQIRKAYVLLANPEKSPVFLAVGKMDTPFGQTGSVSPFTNSTLWHAFGGLAYGAHLGLSSGGLNVNFMAVQGGAQFRSANTIVGDGTNVPSKLNNFVADLNYKLSLSNKVALTAGGSYQKGSAYNQGFPVQHFMPGVEDNPAYTYYGRLDLGSRFFLKGGFAKTVKEWQGTHNPIPPLDVFEASKVSSLDYGAQYVVKQNGDKSYVLSGEFSNFRAGPAGAPWERQNQIVFGFAALLKNSSKLFVELFNTQGYAPLNFISGSNDFEPFPPGTTHSDRDASSLGIVLGANITL